MTSLLGFGGVDYYFVTLVFPWVAVAEGTGV